MKKWGYTIELLAIEPSVVRFQARHSNECWHFDLSPSDLKKLPTWPLWIDSKNKRPQLMLYSVVDDRSGVAYQEYHAVYGEDVEAALRFLYKAMTQKDVEGFPFQGVPQVIYMDNGPISKSRVFTRVMNFLGIEILKHPPKGKDGRRCQP
ncbi:MAG: transposase family protein [Desulfobacteraceae bacterium]|nr:transposase family protein [Desulfobacteraceae bacterium]